MTAEPLLTRADLARLLNCTTRSVDRWRQVFDDFPRPILIGRTVRWDRRAVEAWLASRAS